MPGRPTLLTAELQERLLEYVEGGNYLDTSASLVGIDRKTVQRWVRRGVRELRRKRKQGGPWKRREKPFVDFYRAFLAAKAKAEARNVANINLVARGQPAREIVRERTLEDGTVERTIEKISAVPAQWTASAWYLERTNRERWGRFPTRGAGAAPLTPATDTPQQQEDAPPAPLAEHTEESVLSIVGDIARRAQRRLEERAQGTA